MIILKYNNDDKSGSIAYNRFEFQISQALHMIIDQYHDNNFLLVMDYRDDITFYPDADNPLHVHYYQVKTTEGVSTAATIFGEKWLSKLYSHLSEGDIVEILGLITVYPISIERQQLNASKTNFSMINEKGIEVIKDKISNDLKIPISEIDLSKMIHFKSTLNIESHRSIVESELMNYMYSFCPNISVYATKAAFSTIIDSLSRCQRYEKLPTDATYSEVKKRKGFSKSELTKIVKTSSLMGILPYGDIIKPFDKIDLEIKEKMKVDYAQVISDFVSGSSNISSTFELTQILICDVHQLPDENKWDYVCRCQKKFIKDNPTYQFLHGDDYYIHIVIITSIINGGLE